MAGEMEICEAADALEQTKLSLELAINKLITAYTKELKRDMVSIAADLKTTKAEVVSITAELKTTKAEMVKSKEFDIKMWRMETLLTTVHDDVQSMLYLNPICLSSK